MSLWNIQVYLQGQLISIDLVEEVAVRSMTDYFEDKGYEVRSEPAWKPASSTDHEIEIGGNQAPISKIAIQRPYNNKKQEC